MLITAIFCDRVQYPSISDIDNDTNFQVVKQSCRINMDQYEIIYYTMTKDYNKNGDVFLHCHM